MAAGKVYEEITIDSDSDDDAEQSSRTAPPPTRHIQSVKLEPRPAAGVPVVVLPTSVLRGAAQVGHVRPQVRSLASVPAQTSPCPPLTPVVRDAPTKIPIVFGQRSGSPLGSQVGPQSNDAIQLIQFRGENGLTYTFTQSRENQPQVANAITLSTTTTGPPTAAAVLQHPGNNQFPRGNGLPRAPLDWRNVHASSQPAHRSHAPIANQRLEQTRAIPSMSGSVRAQPHLTQGSVCAGSVSGLKMGGIPATTAACLTAPPATSSANVISRTPSLVADTVVGLSRPLPNVSRVNIPSRQEVASLATRTSQAVSKFGIGTMSVSALGVGQTRQTLLHSSHSDTVVASMQRASHTIALTQQSYSVPHSQHRPQQASAVSSQHPAVLPTQQAHVILPRQVITIVTRPQQASTVSSQHTASPAVLPSQQAHLVPPRQVALIRSHPPSSAIRSQQTTFRPSTRSAAAIQPVASTDGIKAKDTNPQVNASETEPEPPTCAEWSPDSLGSVRALMAMQAHPEKVPVSVQPKQEKKPAPNKASLLFNNFRQRRRSEQLRPERPAIEVVDLSDELPDLDDEACLGSSQIKTVTLDKQPSIIEMLFRQTGSTIGQRLKTLSTPPRAVVSASSSPSTSSIGSVKRKFEDKGDIEKKPIACKQSLMPKCAIAESAPPSSRAPSPILISDSQSNSSDSSVCCVTSNLSDSRGDKVAAEVDFLSLGSSFFKLEPAEVASGDNDNDFTQSPVTVAVQCADDSISKRDHHAISVAPRHVRHLATRSVPKPVASLDRLPAICHSSISPNAGTNAKVTSSLMRWHLLKALAVPSRVVSAEGRLLSESDLHLVKIYFDSGGVHVVHGLELLIKLTSDGSRPQAWVISRLLEYIRQPVLATATTTINFGHVSEEIQESRLFHIGRFFRQLNIAGNLLVYDMPLWELLEWATADLGRGKVTANQLEMIKLVLLVVEEDVARLGHLGAPATVESPTCKYLNPDVHSFQLRDIQDWIVDGLMSGANDFPVLEMLSILSRVLSLSLFVSKDCESSSMRLAEGFCACFRRLPDPKLRRRLLALVRPLMVRTLFLALLLDRFGDKSTVPPDAVRRFAGCKLCFRKVVKFYFHMDGIAVDELTAIEDGADGKATSRKEFLYLVLMLVESYAELLADWIWAGRNSGDFKNEVHVLRELARLRKVEVYAAGFEDRVSVWPMVNQRHIKSAIELIKDTARLHEFNGLTLD